jgi:2-alkyl-3-oxoalkanoate reductase
MRVFVAGATGAIGRRLVPQLVARGHEVIGTTLRPNRLDELVKMGAEAIVLDGLDADAVEKAVAHAWPDAIVHQMTALSGPQDLKRPDRWFAVTNQLRTEGTEHLLAAAAGAGVKRFVAQSFIGWNNSRDGGPVKTEDDPLDPDPLPEQSETLAAIRHVEWAVTSAPLEGLVLRYGNLYGPGASEWLVDAMNDRKLPIVGGGTGVWSFIHVDDAASATVAALDHGTPGIYNVVDDEPTLVAEFLTDLAQIVGARPPMKIPAWVGRLVAGRVVVRMMTEQRGASNAKAKRELGWTPTWSTWRDGFRRGLTVGPATAAGACGR